jgi:hypothetical protein
LAVNSRMAATSIASQSSTLGTTKSTTLRGVTASSNLQMKPERGGAKC